MNAAVKFGRTLLQKPFHFAGAENVSRRSCVWEKQHMKPHPGVNRVLPSPIALPSSPIRFGIQKPSSSPTVFSEKVCGHIFSSSQEGSLDELLKKCNPGMSSIVRNQAAMRIRKFIHTPTLTTCNLSHLELEALPIHLPLIEKLSKRCTRLDLKGNRLKQLPQEFLPPNSQFKSLDLSDNPIQTLPDCLELTKLEQLNIAETKIHSLPKLPTSLRELDAAGSLLEELPEKIESLTRLKYLNLSGTPYHILSPGFEKLPLLKLDLSNTPIKRLPNNISRLSSLEILKCNNTKLEELPSTITHLAQLKELHLQGTPLKELPSELLSHPNLKHIDLKYSQIQCLPATGGPSRPTSVFYRWSPGPKIADDIVDIVPKDKPFPKEEPPGIDYGFSKAGPFSGRIYLTGTPLLNNLPTAVFEEREQDSLRLSSYLCQSQKPTASRWARFKQHFF